MRGITKILFGIFYMCTNVFILCLGFATGRGTALEILLIPLAVLGLVCGVVGFVENERAQSDQKREKRQP